MLYLVHTKKNPAVEGLSRRHRWRKAGGTNPASFKRRGGPSTLGSSEQKGAAMRLTTKGRFAVTAMIDLALRQNNGPVTLAAISQRQQISLSYLEQLFGKLRRHDLVESTRGPGGGYTLGRKAADITVADIIVSVDEPIDATQCGGKENCLGEAGRCMTHELWASLNQRMVEFLDSVSLQKLVDEQLAKGVQVETKPITKRAISSAPVVKP